MEIVAPVAARVAAVTVEVGSRVRASDTLVVLEVMKMEHPVTARVPGRVDRLHVEVGEAVEAGALLVTIEQRDDMDAAPDRDRGEDLSALTEVVERHELGLDRARPEAVAARHDSGHRTTREMLDALCHEFIEYGPLAIAAQRGRRDVDELIRRTPADGMVAGIGRIDTGTVGEDRAIVISYDYTVLAGTQGMQNHRKKDRLFRLAREMGLPVVLFAEGGGGRPGDVDWPGVSLLEVPAFRLFADITGPTIGVNTGYCFAGNAALLGQCDVIVATEESNLGMGGPAMIEGGGLGVFSPEEIGPVEAQLANGVIDVPVSDDSRAVATVRVLLGLTRGPVSEWEASDQAALRTTIPVDRRRLYQVRDVIHTLVDSGTFLEIRPGYARACVTGFARIEGRPLGIIANDPMHRAGAVDHDAATSLAAHLRLCDRWNLPVLSLCDTPGFMVGPEAEAEGLVRSAGDLFRAAAEVDISIGTIVTRRGYGLGAMAMAAGGFHQGRFTLGWPTSEFGPMGLEGAVKLGFKRELEAVEDQEDRQAELERRVAEMYEVGKGVNVASHFEIDDVIDPADSRRWIVSALF